MNKNFFLTDAQLKTELKKCEYCAEKPCKEACPVDCSPADFLMAAKGFHDVDFKRAAEIILSKNPLGGICGAVCPDYHCMKACVHQSFNGAVKIPAVQATIIEKARKAGLKIKVQGTKNKLGTIAVVGAGPAGLGATAVLASRGYQVHLYEKSEKVGGMTQLIPAFRLPANTLKKDIQFALSTGKVKVITGQEVKSVEELGKTYDSVVVAVGRTTAIKVNIPGEEHMVDGYQFIRSAASLDMKGKNVAVIGGGAVAADCVACAHHYGAAAVEMISLENFTELPLTEREFDEIKEANVLFTGRTRVIALEKTRSKIKKTNLTFEKIAIPNGEAFSLKAIKPITGTQHTCEGYDIIVRAIGYRTEFIVPSKKNVFVCGDMVNGPTTVVEAVASGKNAALQVMSLLEEKKSLKIKKAIKSHATIDGIAHKPVDLSCDFFGRKIISPFLLSAAPTSDGIEQMRKAYEAGWAGGVMKTAFDNLNIHIPGEYMFLLDEDTYGNCDNVSGHPLDRVCAEVKQLIQEYPDRLTIASTGGPVTGKDKADKKVWQSNTKKLEKAGAMGIEYSLSCPQGGDGTKGDIVSQDAELTAKIIDWVMEISDPNIPKLFKLTGAVTAIVPILTAIKEVFARYPEKKAGITLANSFPSLAFRSTEDWGKGVVVGMSGEGVANISFLTLASAARVGLTISGNGGPMDYRSAARFLALGVKTVQFCTIATKYGYGIIDDLENGLSHLLAEQGYKSVGDFIGNLLPHPVTDFMDLTPVKKISAVKAELCQHCGNCSRCPYMAITLDKHAVPVTDASKCIGCSICVQKCFAGALYMRTRSEAEAKVLKED